jgi:exopolysaccharide biosynthesis polyprenyl glycosylphosphotransferase
VTTLLALLEAGSIFGVACVLTLAGIRFSPAHWPSITLAVGRSLALALCCVVAFYYNDLYDVRSLRSMGDVAARLPRALVTALALLAAVYLLVPATRMEAAPFLASLVVAAMTLLTLRAISSVAIRSRSFGERVLILGTSPLAEKLVREIETRHDARHHVVGIVADAPSPGARFFPYPVLAPFDHLGRILEGARPDRVVVAMRERRGQLAVQQLLEARMRGVVIEEGVELYERLTGKIAIESLTPSGVIFGGGFRPGAISRALGRGISLLVSVVGLVVLAPLFGLIALTIMLDSRGPVVFRQERAGQGGRRFGLLKFRTMHPVEASHSEWARDNDGRITRVGRWLRRFRLDELPQFVNILRGDMNLVGPRPHPVTNYELFLATVPYYALRATVRPGVTGWAQVRYGYANNLEEETEKMRYDLYYIKHRSFGLDLRILLDTAKVVLLGRDRPAADVDNLGSPAGAHATPLPLRVREE